VTDWLQQLAHNWPRLALKLGRGLAVAAVCVVGLLVCVQVWGRSYPVRDWLVWRLLPLWGYTLVWTAACVAAGSSVLRWLLRGQKLPAVERLLHSMTIGVAGFGSVSYVLGALCLFQTWMAVLLPVLMLAGGWYGVPELWRALGAWRARRVPGPLLRRIVTYLAVGWGLVCVAFVYLEALPLSSINFDASWYHMIAAQDYAREGCLIPFPGENHKAYPHLTSMVHTWAFLVPLPGVVELRWMLALHLEFAIVLWRIVGVAAAAHWLLCEEDTPGIWAVFFLFPSIFVYDQCIGGSADHFLGFFAAPMFLATARALKGFDWRLGALAGIAAGGHMLTKYQSVYMVVAIAAVFTVRWIYLVGKRLVLRLRKRLTSEAGLPSWRAMVLGPLAVILFAALVSSPHFIKNTVFHANPVYPFAGSLFPASHPRHPPGYYEVQKKPRGGPFAPKHQDDFVKRQLWATQLLFTYSFHTANRGFTDHRPYMGSLFSLLLPCVLFVSRRRRILLGTAVGYVAFMVWANTSVNDRYMLSYYDLFIAVAAALLVRVWQVGWLGRVAVVPLVALQLFWGGDAILYYGSKRLRAALSLVSAGYSGKLDGRRLSSNTRQQRITEMTPPDAKIFVRNYRGLLGLDRMVVSDVYEGQAYVSYSGVRDARELWEMLRARGITHLLYPEGRRRPRRLNNVVLFAELAHRSGRNRRRAGDLVLLDLSAEPPPPMAPYLVLSRGNREFPDGLYRVEQLDVDIGNYKRFTPKPKPITRLTSGNVEQLLRRADAVVHAASLPGHASDELKRAFVLFEKVERYSVYLRKQPRRR
jgi:hypothetical protein